MLIVDPVRKRNPFMFSALSFGLMARIRMHIPPNIVMIVKEGYSLKRSKIFLKKLDELINPCSPDPYNPLWVIQSLMICRKVLNFEKIGKNAINVEPIRERI